MRGFMIVVWGLLLTIGAGCPGKDTTSGTPPAAPDKAVEWSGSDKGLRCRLYVDDQLAAVNGPHRAIIFEINNASDTKLLVPAWALDKWLLAVDIQVAGHPDLKSPLLHGDACMASLFLDPGQSFVMNISEHYMLAAGKLKGTMLQPFDPAGREYEISVSFDNETETLGLVDKQVACWTGRIRSQSVRVSLPTAGKAPAAPESPSATSQPKKGPVGTDFSKPQNGLALKLETAEAQYEVGDKITVDFVLKNVSANKLRVYVCDTDRGPKNCSCTLTSPAGKNIAAYWEPAGKPRDNFIEVDAGQETRLTVDLGRYKVASPSHFYRPVGREPLTLVVGGSFWLPKGMNVGGDVWYGHLEAGPIQITIYDPSRPPSAAGVSPWPPEVGRSRALADIAAGKPRILYYGLPWPADKPLVDEKSGVKVEVLEDAIFTMEFAEEINAYNRTIRIWAAKRR